MHPDPAGGCTLFQSAVIRPMTDLPLSDGGRHPVRATLRRMTPHLELLQSVRIASPCPMSWKRMKGDARVRFCGRCERNVYNVSAMSTLEAAELIQAHRANMCVRFYRRQDGRIVTSDCAP